MNKFYKYLTKIGDKLGLARDTKEKNITDGLKHIKPHLIVKLAACAITYLIYTNNYALMLAGILSSLGMLIYWIGSEVIQEILMVRKIEGRNFRFSINRWQDILIPEASGLPFDIILILIWWFTK